MSPALISEVRQLISLRAVSVVMQPVVDLGAARMFGYESAIRGPADGPLHSPLTLFESAHRENQLLPLERLCAEASCRRFFELSLPGLLFLNVNSLSLVDPVFREALTRLVVDELGISPKRIVIEITEQHPLDDFALIRQIAGEYRRTGFHIALDDLGAGYAGLRIWSELKPDFVKIDRHFIQNIHEDPAKQDFVRSILEISRGLNTRVIAEGIETAEELLATRRLGIHLGQGFLLGMPRPQPTTVVPDAVLSGAPSGIGRAGSKLTAGELARPSLTVGPEVSAETVLDHFHADRALLAIPVVEGAKPLGLVQRQEMFDLFSERYRRELQGRLPVTRFLQAKPIMVDADLPLSDVSRLITDDPEAELPHVFIITQGGHYRGVGKTRALLRRITEQQIVSARHSNPLTLLPGSVPIAEHIEQLLEADLDFRVAYCDLNHFKPYNDLYGYARGDAVIRLLADILCQQTDSQLDFLGHVGGDDFVLIFRSLDWMARCQAILNQFEREVQRCYSEKVIREGVVRCEDRRGNVQTYPLISLAIGVVHPDPSDCSGHNDVSALAADAKHHAKKAGGNALFVCRRRHSSASPGATDAAESVCAKVS